jgi:hypothetical protein
LPALLALLALVVLAGCASGQDTVALPSLDAAVESSSLSSSPDPSPTAVSDEKVQVEAAVRAYFAAMDQTVRTGSGDPYRAVATADCTCRRFALTVEREWARAPLLGAAVHLDDSEVTAAEAGQALASVEYTTAAYRQVAEGRTSRVAGARVRSFLRLELSAGGWLVADEDVMERVVS